MQNIRTMWRPISRLTFACASALVAVGTLAAPVAQGQTAQLGSDGSDGALNITTDTTIPLPADGVFHHTTVNIASGATLTFSYSGPYHLGVVLLATGNVTIDGTIDISGEDATLLVGGAAGPGGTAGSTGGLSYGADRIPAVPGHRVVAGGFRHTGLRLAGGAGGIGDYRDPLTGAGGGGAGTLMIISNTEIAGAGFIDAHGGASDDGNANSYPGQGGTIRMIAPRVDASEISIVSRYLRLDAIFHASPPDSTNLGRALETGNVLSVWPANMPTAAITEVAGQAANTSEVLILPPGESQPYDVTVRVLGCTASQMTVFVVHQNDGQDRTTGAVVTVMAPTGDDTVTVQVDPAIAPFSGRGRTNEFTPTVHCGVNSVP